MKNIKKSKVLSKGLELDVEKVTMEELQEQYAKINELYKQKVGILNLAVVDENFVIVRDVSSSISELAYFLQQLQVIMQNKKN